MPRIDGIIGGEEPSEPGCIPLEVFDAIIADSRGSELDKAILNRVKKERGTTTADNGE